jgi:ArsR family transcriptional regulator, virulence genes transcriptional regulator
MSWSATPLSETPAADHDFAIDRAVEFLRSLASPHRLKVLCQLVDGEKSVGAMERAVGLRQATLSQHLARLRADGLVATRRDGQSILYRLASPEAEQVLTVMKALFCDTPATPEP